MRASLQGRRALGPKAEELSNFLETALKDEDSRHPSLDFATLKYARLDKLLADLLVFVKALRRSTLASELSLPFRVDVSNANNLMRAWRRRFREEYITIDLQRRTGLWEDRLKHITYVHSSENDSRKWVCNEDVVTDQHQSTETLEDRRKHIDHVSSRKDESGEQHIGVLGPVSEAEGNLQFELGQ